MLSILKIFSPLEFILIHKFGSGFELLANLLFCVLVSFKISPPPYLTGNPASHLVLITSQLICYKFLKVMSPKTVLFFVIELFSRLHTKVPYHHKSPTLCPLRVENFISLHALFELRSPCDM